MGNSHTQSRLRTTKKKKKEQEKERRKAKKRKAIQSCLKTENVKAE